MKCRSGLRHASFMIELSTVIVIAGILASSSAIVLRQAYRVHRDSLATVGKMRSLDLLRLRWTSDVQAASSAQIGDTLELRLSHESLVTYSIDDKTIERKKYLGGQIVSHDSWRFSDSLSLFWSLDSSQPLLLLSMELRSLENSEQPPPWRFLARLNVTPSDLPIGERRDE